MPSVCAEKYGCPQCVPKSTSVTLAVDEKTLPIATITGRTDRQTDGQTDRQTDGQTECDAICGPPPREEGRIKTCDKNYEDRFSILYALKLQKKPSEHF